VTRARALLHSSHFALPVILLSPRRGTPLPSRQFRDASGAQWDVWDVHPQDALQRTSYDRRNSERGGDPDDGFRPERNAVVDPLLEDGWLCFQSGSVRRRFAPIPPAWSELPDPVLRVMVDIASPVGAAPPIQTQIGPESR